MTPDDQKDKEALDAAVVALVKALRPLVKRNVGTLKLVEARRIASAVINGWVKKRSEQHAAEPVEDLDAFIRTELPFDDSIADIGNRLLD